MYIETCLCFMYSQKKEHISLLSIILRNKKLTQYFKNVKEKILWFHKYLLKPMLMD